MSWDAVRQALLCEAVPLATVRKYKLDATQRLLGSTIALSEQAWQEPARLPGWTRAHVATHLARNAEAFIRAIDSVLMGRRGLMYDSDEDRDLAIERGSERRGLELQIDLDTSAGRLNRRFNVLDSVPSDLMVELLPGQLYRAALVPLVRLNEVALHHVDLDCGFEVQQIDPAISRLLLEWNCLTAQVAGPGVRIESESGFSYELGSAAPDAIVRGGDGLLLGWLTGRLRPEDALELPAPPYLV